MTSGVFMLVVYRNLNKTLFIVFIMNNVRISNIPYSLYHACISEIYQFEHNMKQNADAYVSLKTETQF